MRFGRPRLLLLVAGAAVLLLVAVPVAAFAWLLWQGDELIPYPDGPPPVQHPQPAR